MAHWAKPGVKCVCVSTWSDQIPDREPRLYGPVEGTVYTIREAGFGLNMRHPDAFQVRLVEIANPVGVYLEGIFEAAFSIDRFRPLVSRTEQQDVALFRHPLKPAGVDA